MLNKKILKDMFNFTTNKRKTIIVGIVTFVAAIPYILFYQYLLSRAIDIYIPEKNINMVIILSNILISIIIIRFFLDKYSEVNRKNCYYENDMQIKDKVFNAIQEADISKLDKIQVGNLFNLTTTQSFESSQLFPWNFVGIFTVRLRSVLITSIIMLFIDWQIAIIVIGIFILSYLILIPFYNKNINTEYLNIIITFFFNNNNMVIEHLMIIYISY